MAVSAQGAKLLSLHPPSRPVNNSTHTQFFCYPSIHHPSILPSPPPSPQFSSFPFPFPSHLPREVGLLLLIPRPAQRLPIRTRRTRPARLPRRTRRRPLPTSASTHRPRPARTSPRPRPLRITRPTGHILDPRPVAGTRSGGAPAAAATGARGAEDVLASKGFLAVAGLRGPGAARAGRFLRADA